jgi:uncharacterized protein (DUF302 family)
MHTRRESLAAIALTTAAVLAPGGGAAAAVADDGIVRVRSAHPMAETITRLKADIAAKGIMFFSEIDQARLAAEAGIELLPSVLLVFGNPPLGTLFLTSDADCGLDWPVRLLVHQDADGAVWAIWTDFAWIARRHGITDRAGEFAMATEVVTSITSTIRMA